VPDDQLAPPHRLTHSQVTELIGSLEELLAAIGAGDLDATSACKQRIEGALVALRVVNGSQPRQQIGTTDPLLVAIDPLL
jgi:hypothetical protein